MVYRGEDRDDLMLCVMYRGRLADLPAADRVTRRGDFVFHLFRRGDPHALLELAAAKAMLAPGVRRGS